MAETTIQIQVVKGGFILQTYGSEDSTTEVFVSPGKLIKSVRTIIENGKNLDKAGPAEDDGE